MRIRSRPVEPGRGTLAIDAHVDRLDGGPPAARHSPRRPHRFSAPPLEEVTVHLVDAPPHWHLVTRGLSELRAKESPDRELSGWGFELSFRIAGEEQDPRWGVDLLFSLAAYVWSERRPFGPGHHLDLRGPIRLGAKTAVTAAILVVDPVLGRLVGPYGSLEFLQVVGLTAEELELCRAFGSEVVLEQLSASNPLLVTSLERPSLSEDPRWAAGAPAAGGEPCRELHVGSLVCKARLGQGLVVQLGSGAAAALGPALRRALGEPGSSFTLVGDGTSLRFSVAREPGWRADSGAVEVFVPKEAVEGFAALFDGRIGWGSRPGYGGLRFRVVR